MLMDFVNPFKQLIIGFKSFLSVHDEEQSQGNFFDALRQTLNEKDFKGSIHEIHPVHSQLLELKQSGSHFTSQSSDTQMTATAQQSEEIESPKALKRVMSAPPNQWKSTW